MAIKIAVIMLAALTVVTAYLEKEKRQSGSPDFSEYFNQFQEQMKPITGQFPSLPNGQLPSLPNGQFPSLPNGQLPSLPNGQLPSLPNGFGSFPGFPGMSGSSGGNSQYKRQISPNTISEWFNQFQETGNNFSGNLPFKPSFGQFPFPGSSSESSESNENKKQ